MAEITSPNDYRAKHHRQVALPSGAVFLIRKLTQRDYLPRGLVGLYLKTGDLDESAARAYLAEHPDEALSQDEEVILKGTVLPKIVRHPEEASGDSGALFVGDLDKDDRAALIRAINEHSGFAVEAQRAQEKFRGAALGDAGLDGEVVRQDA